MRGIVFGRVSSLVCYKITEQEAQLTQRGRETVSVVVTLKCSLGSLKMVGLPVEIFPFALHRIYGRIFSRFNAMHERDRQIPSQIDTEASNRATLHR